MAGFAKEFGMTNLLTSTSGRLDQGEGVGLKQGDEGRERGGFGHVGSPTLTSRDGVDERSLERSHAMSRQVWHSRKSGWVKPLLPVVRALAQV